MHAAQAIEALAKAQDSIGNRVLVERIFVAFTACRVNWVRRHGERYENSFNQYTVPDAILRFRQGFDSLGRVHQGRGIVAILDKRLTSKEYGQSFLETLHDATVKRALLAHIGATAQESPGAAATSALSV